MRDYAPPAAAVSVPRTESASLPVVCLIIALLGFPLLIGLAQGGAAIYQRGSETHDSLVSPPPVVTFFRRVAMIIEPLLALAALAHSISVRGGFSSPRSAAGAVWLTFLLYWLCQTGRCAVLAPVEVVINPRYWYSALLCTTFYAAAPFPYATLFRIFQKFVWLTTSISFLLLPILPEWVSAPSSTLVFERISFRLHGPFCHANHFAYMLVAYLLLPRPASNDARINSLGKRLLDVGVILAFILAQSKTLYLLLPMGLAVKWMIPLLPARGAARTVAIFTILFMLGTFAFLQLSGGSFTTQLFGWTPIRAETLESLTGRREVWNAMLDDWSQRYWFGYGANTWKEEGMWTVRWGAFVASHAHSQIVQTLWETGLVGLVTLALHVATLLYASTRATAWMQAGLIATMLVVVARTITETSLCIMYFDDIQIAFFMLLMLIIMSAVTESSTTLTEIA